MDKTVLILVNHDIVIYNFRKELVERLINEGYNVVISSPYGSRIDNLIKMGATYEETEVNRHGKNILEEFNLFIKYNSLIRKYNPKIVLGYTIKPNIYGAFATKFNAIPFIANITGLGSSIYNKGILQKLLLRLYKYAFKNIHKVFFQNQMNLDFFKNNYLVKDNYSLLPGSGVNVDYFNYIPYPNSDKINFLMVSRIMKDKGIEEFLKMAKIIKEQYKNVNFHICGFCEENYQDILEEYSKNNTIKYHGMVDDIRIILKDMHCIIHPSYHEGLSNVLLEASSSGRPVIASDIPGCQETFDEGVSGFGFEVGNVNSLVEKVEKFISLSNEERELMGRKAREKVVEEFNRDTVVEIYAREIEKIKEGQHEFI